MTAQSKAEQLMQSILHYTLKDSENATTEREYALVVAVQEYIDELKTKIDNLEEDIARIMRDFTHTDELWEEEAHGLDNYIKQLEAENEKLRNRPPGIGDGDITAALDERDALRAENKQLKELIESLRMFKEENERIAKAALAENKRLARIFFGHTVGFPITIDGQEIGHEAWTKMADRICDELVDRYLAGEDIEQIRYGTEPWPEGELESKMKKILEELGHFGDEP